MQFYDESIELIIGSKIIITINYSKSEQEK
jgi:hypothetical protein